MKLNTSFSVARNGPSEASKNHDAVRKKTMPVAFQLMTIILITIILFFLVSQQFQKSKKQVVVPLPPRPVPSLEIPLPLKIAVLDQHSIQWPQLYSF